MSITDVGDILPPSELDSEEESPYLRRQKPVPVRRSRFSRAVGVLLQGVLVGIVGLLPVSYAGYHVATFALASPRFRVNSAEDIMVSGNHFVSREEILNALGIAAAGTTVIGSNIFRLPLEEKEKQVEAIPWVRSAILIRVYPNRLAVSVVERTPVAFVNISGQVKLVDGEGVLLEWPEKAVFDFPVLRGLDPAGGGTEGGGWGGRLALYQEFARQLEPEAAQSGWLISEVDLADADDLKALLVQGRETIQVHFGQKDFLERFRNFLALLPEVRKTNAKIDSVDLRYHNQILVNPVAKGAGGMRLPEGGRGDLGSQKE